MPRHRSNETQVVRCIALLIAMARAKRGINIRQFAERRGWHWRASYRDIATLRAAGVPIEHEHGWFRVVDHWIPTGAVDVADDELLVLFAMRHLVPGLKDTVVGRALDSLWAKLAEPTRQRSLPFGDQDWLVVRSAAPIDYRPHRPVFDTLRAAIEARRVVELRYRTAHGVETVRRVEPAFLCWEGSLETLYVRAWCRLREDFRTFAVHRITGVSLASESFAARGDAATGLSQAFRIWCGPTVERVVVRFAASVAGEVRERRLHPSQVETAHEDGSLTLALEVASPEELERWLLGFGPDVEVLAPARLATRVRERHRAAARGGQATLLRAAPRARTGALRAPRRARSGG